MSWGKIRIDAKPVKIYADATLVFPLLVAQTFAKTMYNGERYSEKNEDEGKIIVDKNYTELESKAEIAKLGEVMPDQLKM